MIRRSTLPVLLVGAALLTGCSTASTGSTASADGSCADLVIFGARGSTQNPDINHGVGTEVRKTSDRLIKLVSDRSHTTSLEAIDYNSAAAPSLDAFTAQAAAGSSMMVERLRSVARACPDSRFALLGFSQGAQVVHGASTAMSASLARRVALVAMIADPQRDPADPIRHWSYSKRPTTSAGKLGPGRPIDPDLRAVAISLCVVGDEICNARGASVASPSTTHKHFYEKPTTVRATAHQLDRILQPQGL